MRGPLSAYTALELEPGADRAAVEEAYRRLIKRYHPDRSGGDAKRAAEINRAYFELRSLPAPVPRAPVAHAPTARRSRRKHRRPTPLWPLAGLALAAFVVVWGDRLMIEGPRWASWLANIGSAMPAPIARSAAAAQNASLDEPLAEATIARSVRDAVRLVHDGDEAALVDQSRDCHRLLRAAPTLVQLDRCAAFDGAAAALEDRDPDHDTGPFNASSVTARQMTAASLLSNDYLAIERRLNRIRATVELALRASAPPPAEPPPEASASVAELGADAI